MKGFVPTPVALVDRMVHRLFERMPPRPRDIVIDPGAGEGAFVDGILRWTQSHKRQVHSILAIESHPDRAAFLRRRFRSNPGVRVINHDFLGDTRLTARYIVGNPPYVPITGLSEKERARYRSRFGDLARGRTDLYLLFFARAIDSLEPGGRAVLVTPEKYLYVATAAPLRRRLSALRVEEVNLLPEDTFTDLATYPAVTVVRAVKSVGATIFQLRDGRVRRARTPTDGSSWLPTAMGYSRKVGGPTLNDLSRRISPGVATGADKVFVIASSSVGPDLAPFARPTISGRDLKPGAPMPAPSYSLLVPYANDGRLRSPEEVDRLIRYLSVPERQTLLSGRTCVRRKPWYAFHDSAPLDEIQRPKLMWKDISDGPAFWVDRAGTIIPRHSVYYLVPKDPAKLDRIADYLSSDRAAAWLSAHCQRAMKGFLRLQSNVLREMPVPLDLVAEG